RKTRIFVLEYEWQLWRFERVPNNYFSKEENIKKYMRWLESSLFISNPIEWYDISLQILWEFHGIGFAKTYKELTDRLNGYYILENPFVQFKFTQTWEKSQKFLYRIIRSLIPKDCEILENYFGTYHSEQYVLLDIYIPSLNI